MLTPSHSRISWGEDRKKQGLSIKVGFLIRHKNRKNGVFCQGFEVKKFIKKPTFFDRREC
jgi:hypothetical protein